MTLKISHLSIDDIYAEIVELWLQRPDDQRSVSHLAEFINELNRNDRDLLPIIREQGSFGSGICNPYNEILRILQPFTLNTPRTQTT